MDHRLNVICWTSFENARKYIVAHELEDMAMPHDVALDDITAEVTAMNAQYRTKSRVRVIDGVEFG
jgi:hypothetical protein